MSASPRDLPLSVFQSVMHSPPLASLILTTPLPLLSPLSLPLGDPYPNYLARIQGEGHGNILSNWKQQH